MQRIASSVLIDGPPQKVWDVITDIANAPKWDPAAIAMTQTSPGPPGAGTTLHLTLAEYPKVEDSWVIDYEPNRRFSLEYTSGPVKGTRMAFDIVPIDGKTKLSLLWTLQCAGLGGRGLSHLNSTGALAGARCRGLVVPLPGSRACD